MDILERLDGRDWDHQFTAVDQERAVEALEQGRVLCFERLAFPLKDTELRLLSSAWSDQRAKNISFDPNAGSVNGAKTADGGDGDLLAMMGRYAAGTQGFLKRLLLQYTPALKQARTSFRPHEIEGRQPQSYRKDDRLLHADAFPSRPTRGARILRVFTNINPSGKPRVWHVGEPFGAFARRFLPDVRRAIPGVARIEAMFGITKGQRTEYDHIMLQLHDRAKRDARYQREAPRQVIAFPAGSTWVVFTDLVPHAAMSGQFALEQTFELPVAAQLRPELSPLRILERLAGRSLVA
jgi:3-deoxy-D-manno-octulosonic acid hydroxylase-like protein